MKIAVIGGAGVRTVIFINGLLKRYKKLHIDEVVLYDICLLYTSDAADEL